MSFGLGRDDSGVSKTVSRRTFLRSAAAVGLFGAASGAASAQASSEDELAIAWERTFGGDGQSTAEDFLPTADGGYLLVGRTDSFGAGGSDAYLVKTDADGGFEYDRLYGGQDDDSAVAVQRVDDGYVVAGTTESFTTATEAAWLFRTDDRGRMRWNLTIDGSLGEALCTTDEGASLLAYRDVSGETDAAGLAEVGPAGDLRRSGTYGTSGSDDRFTSVVETADGAYLAAGTRRGAGSGPSSGWLVKTDTDGDVLWERTLGGEQSDRLWDVVGAVDGGYLLAGDSDPFGGPQAWLVKTSSEGVVQWNQLLGEAVAPSVVPTEDDGYLLAAGPSGDPTTGPIYLAKTDDSGSKQWETRIGNAAGHWPGRLRQTPDGYVLAGTRTPAEGSMDAWLVKLGIGRFPGAEGPPRSADDDPLFEDIDGDGDTDIFDALTYYNERDSALVRNNPRRFDFDGQAPSGSVFDALELYNEIS